MSNEEDTKTPSTAQSGIAGRINYSEWNTKTAKLLSDLDEEEKEESNEASKALGLEDGKYARSEAEKAEHLKQKSLEERKAALEGYRKKEQGLLQTLSDVFKDDTNADAEGKSPTYLITRDNMPEGKRVLTVSDTTGPGTIIVSKDISNLKSTMPSNINNALTPKSYPQDSENDVAEEKTMDGHVGRPIYGLIKLHLNNLHNVTVRISCKVITGVLEVAHCSNITIQIEKESSIVTTQIDLCKDVTMQFNDSPSGKQSTATNGTMSLWGSDKDDRIFHAGVSNLKVQLYKNGVLDKETKADYEKDGAVVVGNATKEEMQFITSVVDGKLLTEKVSRVGGSGMTTASSESGSSGNVRAMTEREMKEVEKRKELIRKAVDERLGGANGIKILNKDGEEVSPKSNSIIEEGEEDDDGVVEEVYTGMSPEDIVKECENQKAEGNKAFVAGEYAQAVLHYTMALDKAAELPDNDDKDSPPLFHKHVALSNRSACFLKLGHHEKALADGTEAEKLNSTYVKGVFRKGLALHAMGRYQEAVTSLAAALKLEPQNKQIKQALQFADVRLQQEMRKRMSR